MDKLKALSECFQITIDELTENQVGNASCDIIQESEDAPSPKIGERKIGIYLCLIGAVCLIVFGIVTVFYPSSVSQINESSMIVLNGTGILFAFFALIMMSGIFLVFKRK